MTHWHFLAGQLGGVNLAALLTLAPAIAQASPDAKGVRVGSNAMDVTNDGALNVAGSTALNANPGFEVGAYIAWRRSPTFAMQLEGLVSNRRLFSEMCAPCHDLAQISLWYLELPFLLRLDLLPGNTKFHLDVGPTAALTLGGGMTPTDGEYQRFGDLLPFNLGVVAGAGIEFPAGPGRVTVDLRYQRWVLDLTGSLDSGNPSPGFSNGSSALGSSHQILALVGYAFP